MSKPVVAMVLAVNPNSPPPFLKINDNGGSFGHYSHLLHFLNECKTMSQLKQIHAQTLRTTSSLFLYSRILHFSSNNDLEYACRVFDQIENPNSFMWNTLIRAFARSYDDKERAILVFKEMMVDGGVLPDKHTFPFVLKACAYLFALFEGKQLHGLMLKFGFESDVYVNNSLIHLYASCGVLECAHKVFDKMSDRSLVSWNVMIDGLVQFGEFNSAFKLFGEMQDLFEPDGYAIQSVLSACAGLGALSLGMWVHAYMLRNCDVDVINDVLVNSSLVDMYCKCGSLELAQQVFESMPIHDVASWNYMIIGFAIHGRGEKALEYFDRMVRVESLMPNSITFVGVLSACNHRGMISEGHKYFEMMISEYRIIPQLEHYGCLVDLLARDGRIDEALDVVADMPMKPDMVIWRSLLDACCKKNASVELSEEVAGRILESEGVSCSGVYVLLSRVYASARRWNDVGMVRKLMTDNGITKEPGCSSIEMDGVTHEFFAGDTSHPRTKEIYQIIDVIDDRLQSIGYSPDCSQAPLVDEVNEGKQQLLSCIVRD